MSENPFASFEAFVDRRPRHGYGLILADPSWDYESWSTAGERSRIGERRSPSGTGNSPTRPTNPRTVQAHYACHPVEAMAAMRIHRIAARDCWLVMWATMPMLPDALELMRAWGFRYSTGGDWLKRTNSAKGWHLGTGHVLRGNPELFLIGRLGKPAKPPRGRVPRALLVGGGDREGLSAADGESLSIIDIRRQHSRKPEAIYDICEELAQGRRCAELFSRSERPGWDAWGDEVGLFSGRSGDG